MLKVYTLIYDFSLSTPIEVDGKTETVIFGGGCKAMRQNGEFSTSDIKWQQAIEQSSGYGQIYKLSKIFGKAEQEQTALSPPAMLQSKVCKNINEAAEWLSGLGCRKTDVRSSPKAIAAARGLGYQLTFEKGV